MANPTLLDMPIARDGNKNAIPTTDNGTTGLLSQQYGWQLINAIPPQQGGKAVKREDFNGALYLLSNLLFYLQKGWQFEWDANQNYYAGCTVKDTADGKTYVCIADVNASTTHPSSDTTHWKLSNLATKDDLANYLPLAGGAMTGNNIKRNVDNSALSLTGATSQSNGAWVELFGKDASGNKNKFLIQAGPNSSSRLTGAPDGTLTWGGANVLTDANGGYLPLSGGVMTGNIYANKSNNHFDIFSGPTQDENDSWLQLFSKNFTGSQGAGSFILKTGGGKDLHGKADGTLTWNKNDLGGSAIVAKSLSTTGYSKRADGLIEQWGQTTAPATISDKVPVTFPITFPTAVSSVVITSEGNLTEGNSAVSYTQVIDVTTSGFKYRSFYNSPSEIKKYWRAIGY